jgi:hypothetical protein
MNGMNYAIGAYIVGLGLMIGYAMWLCMASIAVRKREKRRQIKH